MKKIISIFINTFVILIAIIFLFACTSQALATPTNVKIDETGYITWDAVDNASSYVIVIDDTSYTTSNTYYQIKDIRYDFEFSIYAKGNGFDDSQLSATVSFIGTSSAEKQNMKTNLFTIANVPSIITTGTDNEMNSIVDNLYNHDITNSDITYYKTLFNNLLVQDTAYDTIIEMSKLSKKEIISFSYVLLNLARFDTYHSELLTNFISTYQYDSITYDALCEYDYDLATAIGDIMYSILHSYTSLSVSVIPDILQLAQSSDWNSQIDKIVSLKNSVVKVLQSNMILSSDLATIVKFGYKTRSCIAYYLEKGIDKLELDYDLDLEALSNYLNNLELTDEEIDKNCKTFINNYATFLNTLLSLDASDVKEIVAYFEDATVAEAIVNIIYDKFAYLLEQYDFVVTTDKLELVISSVTEMILDTDIDDVLEEIGLTKEEYEALVTSLSKLINDNYQSFKDLLLDKELALKVVKALEGINVETSDEEKSVTYSTELDNISSDLNTLISKLNLETLEETLYEYTNCYSEDGTLYLEITSFTIESIDLEADTIKYLKTTYVITIEDVSIFVEILSDIETALKDKITIDQESLTTILNSLLSVDEIKNNDTIKEILEAIKNCDEVQFEEIKDELTNLIEDALSYLEEIDVNELIASISNKNLEDIQTLLEDFGTEENLEKIDNLLDKVFSLLDDDLFTETSKEETLTSIKEKVHSIFQKEDPAE